MSGIRISGWSSHLPEKSLTNHDLSEMMDTDHDWIVDRTGISSRHVGGSTVDMAIAAGREAIERSGVDPAAIDLVILATVSPDQVMPASACTVQRELGLDCGAYDLNAACSGFVYGLISAAGMAAMGYEKILMIGSDALSSWVDWTDRGTAILFGDGAGAVVIERDDEPHLLGFDLGADGSAAHILYTDHGGHITMDGREVFRRAVRAMVGSSERALAQAGVSIDEIDWVLPHQANVRIIESACKRLGAPVDKAIMVLDHTGNTSSASIPLALDAAAADGRVTPGDLLLLTGFGAGMTWASAVVRWNP